MVFIIFLTRFLSTHFESRPFLLYAPFYPLVNNFIIMKNIYIIGMLNVSLVFLFGLCSSSQLFIYQTCNDNILSLHGCRILHLDVAHHRLSYTSYSIHGTKYLHKRVAYYANSTATFQLLLLAGDIHQNPGPFQECILCNKPIYNKYRVQCTSCSEHYH